MSQFDSVLSSLKNETYSAKKHLLEYLLHIVQDLQKRRRGLDQTDKDALLTYAYSEVEAITSAISNTASYKDKDLLFACEDLILGLIMHLCASPAEIPPKQFAKIEELVALVAKERYIETALNALFEQQTIAEDDIGKVLALVNQTEDEYQRGVLYSGLVHYKDSISKITDAGKALISAHITAEWQRYLALGQLTEDHLNNLELSADISQYFTTDALADALQKILLLGHNNVNYYAADTLLSAGQAVAADIIASLAKDLGYADLTYAMLAKHGKQDLFPQEYTNAEYLAKSDMVHWLMYPTELGKVPDAIEYVGKITYLFKKEVYYVFKFRSDSDTLGADLKNKWLIGWSSEDGGTFSNFDEYARFEKNTVAATLKNIKKKLLG